MTNAAIDAPMAEARPQEEFPSEMIDAFSYGDKIRVVYGGEVLNQRYMGNAVSLRLHSPRELKRNLKSPYLWLSRRMQALTSEWTENAVNTMMHQCQAGELQGTYDVTTANLLVEALKRINIEGAPVLVIGSENPWVEACALGLGAKDITTIEYGGIQSRHPHIQIFTPDQMRTSTEAFMERFDAVITYSSVEYSGLGRYGDTMNPWGDRQAIARAWSMTKPGGRIALGVPYNPTDTIY